MSVEEIAKKYNEKYGKSMKPEDFVIIKSEKDGLQISGSKTKYRKRGERFMLKPITFNVVGANVQLSIIDCIPVAFIIMAVANFCLAIHTKNDLEKKNLLIEKSITWVKRSIITAMAIFAFSVFRLLNYVLTTYINML